MKTSRYILITAVILLIGLSEMTLARPNVRVGVNIGGGRSGFNVGYRNYDRRGSFRTPHNYRHREPSWGHRGQGWNRRHYRPYRNTIIIGGSYLYDSRPDYYVVNTPTVIEKRVPVVIDRPVIVVRSQEFDENTIQLNLNLQRRKSELLGQLQASDKELRRQAIIDLAGFSFDDNVRYALENVLFSDSSSELRVEAAEAFGRVKNAEALPALEKARVEDVSADVRRAADDAIKSIEGN
ncbi:MAG: HEAT repeat domain-containing protein [Sedimentisphaerales bacterium]|nr:HEAT repeat domain-containing protein [Sedimentisphaerales bacterium]